MQSLSGELISYLFNVLLLTAAIAPLVLWRYGRAVLAGMMARPGATLPLPLLSAAHAAAAGSEPAARAWERRLRWRVPIAAGAAALLAALPLCALELYVAGEPWTPVHLFTKAGVLALVAVPVAAVLCATGPWRALGIGLGALLLLAAAAVLLSMLQRPFYGRSPSWDQAYNALQFIQLAAVVLWLPLLLGLVCGARRVRGVAPLVFAGLLVFGLAPLLGLRLTQWLSGTSGGAEWMLSGPGIDAGFVLIALPVGLLAWWRLKALARAYQAKRFSDAQLLASTWWLLLVGQQALLVVSSNPRPLPVAATFGAAALSWWLFMPLLARGLRWAAAHPGRPAPRLLLVLRVFGDSARSEALFDRVVSRWRWFGPVATIAAPDIVARTVDPGDFLRFVSSDLAAEFVTTADDLQRRLATLDRAPDPDGRYRINEFCCRDSSWQATVVSLIGLADVVLMDLRGFGPQRAGCAFELGQLQQRRSAQVVLLVDGRSDQAAIEPLLGSGAQRLPLLVLQGRAAAQADTAFGALLAAG